MGFASGFGEAFAQSYGQARQLKARKEENEYEWRMKGLFEEKEARTKLEAKTKKAQADAKSISEQTGAPLKEVYSRLLDGTDYDSAYKWAENGDWSGVKYNGGSLDPMTVPDPQSLDSEMTGSGLAAAESPVNETGTSTRVSTDEGSVPYKRKPKVMKPEEQVASLQQEYSLPTTSPERKTEIEGQLRGFGAAKDFVDPPRAEGNLTKVGLAAQIATAKNPEERAQLQNALDSINAEEANAGKLAAGPVRGVAVVDGELRPTMIEARRTDDGQVKYFLAGTNQVAEGARASDDQEVREAADLAKMGERPEVQKQNEKVISLTSGLRSSARLQAIVAKDEGVLPGVTGAAVDFIDSARKEFQAATNLLGVELRRNGAGEVEAGSMEALAQKVDGIDVNAITDRAELRDLFNAELSILAYRMGIAEGQSGNAFSEKDYNRIAGALRGSTSGPAFTTNINAYMSGQLRAVQDSGDLLSATNKQIERFKDQYGYNPVGAFPSPDSFIAEKAFDDEELKAGYLAAKSAKPFAGIDDKTPNTQNTSTPNVKNDDGWTSTPNGTKFRRVQ